MGGTSSTVEQPAKFSVLRKSPDQPDVVIIPVDASKQAESAFLWYVKHVHKPENVVRIIHCHEVQSVSPLRGEHELKASESWSEMMARTKKEGENLVNRFEDKLHQNQVNGSVHFESGTKPGEMVIAAAEKYKGSMIVMGSRGYGLLRRTVLGSVSEYVLHHTKVPVTVIPPETQHWFF